MTPKDYLQESPIGSVAQKSEAETVFQNILIILRNTGNEWRTLGYSEYARHRARDGNYSKAEKEYFDQVIDYAHPERIGLFAPGYKKLWKAAAA